MENAAPDGPVPAAPRHDRTGGSARLAELIRRYGKPIERDLCRIYRLDLAAEWRSRRWRRLLNLIDGLPRNSAYIEALADDEQLAEQMLDQPPPPQDERWSEWSPERETLTIVADRLGELIRVSVAAAGGKPSQSRPLPRPTTASARLRSQRRAVRHRQLVARVLPGR